MSAVARLGGDEGGALGSETGDGEDIEEEKLPMSGEEREGEVGREPVVIMENLRK